MKFRFLIKILPLLIVALNVRAGESVFIYPFFDTDREFKILDPRSGTALEIQDSWNVFVFDEAVEKCQLDLGEIKADLVSLLKKGGRVENGLSPLFSANLKDLKVQVLIESFGNRNETFASYFLRDQPKPGRHLIVLDCSEVSRENWAASLTHEIVHALLAQDGIDSWFEEGIAMLLEENMGGQQPSRRVQDFSRSTAIPTLLENRRPLGSSDSYAMGFLFTSYILSSWGGWSTLQAMIRPSKECDSISDFLSKIACRAKENVKRVFPARFSDQMTREGILKFFAVALTMNHRKTAFYNIYGWSGFRAPPTSLLDQQRVLPSQFLRASPLAVLGRVNPSLLFYSVWVKGDDFRIEPSVVAQDASYLLILNASTQAVSLYE